MSVTLSGDRIVVAGETGLGDAEALLALLVRSPSAIVDVSAAAPLHTALWQILLARQPCVEGLASDPFAARWLPRLGGDAPELAGQ
jgi:hypothetical protein